MSDTTTDPNKSLPLRNRQNCLELADGLAISMVSDQSMDANQTAAINAIKADFKPRRDKIKKAITALKRRLGNWIAKNAPDLFDGEETGTVRTNLIEISRRRNPVAIVPIDRDATEDQLINLALQHECDAVIETRQVIRKDQLQFLDDDVLRTIGWQRQTSHTLTFAPLANTTRKTSTKS
jgi:phage host-nuclease inhibitor protein Gam